MPLSMTPPKVVVIELSQHDQEVFCSLLAGDGYDAEAVGVIDDITTPREHIDLVILTIDLLTGDSFDQCCALQADKALRQTPFLYLSEQSDSATIEDAYDAGATAFCAKPISSQAFICQARSLIKMRTVYKDNQIQKAKARETALCSMKEAQRLRAMVNMLHHAFECHTYADLMQAVFDFCHAHDYDVRMMIQYKGRSLYYSDDGKKRPFEEKIILNQWQGLYEDKTLKTRIIEHNGRVIASFKHCSILVRTADGSTDDLLDFFGFLMNSLDRLVAKITQNSPDPLAPAQIPLKKAANNQGELDEDNHAILF
jgi:CheY-like chemotaxis protein